MATGAQVWDMDRVTELAGRAAEAYGLAGARVELLNISENATFAVDAGDGRTVLRVHRHGYHQPGAIASELAWIDALRGEAGVRTPRIIAARSGERIVRVADGDGPARECVMFEFAPGAEPTGDFERLGAVTARMHQHARSWARPSGFTRFAWDFDAAFGAELRWGAWRDGIAMGPEELSVLGRAEAVLRDELSAMGTGPECYGLIHADLRQANLLDEAGELTVIDFDDCGFGWYISDLASALSFVEHEPRVPELIDSWLRGYRTVAEPVGVEHLGTFILYRRLLLTAWIGSHQSADIARELGPSFTAGTCDIAENYLGGHRVQLV